MRVEPLTGNREEDENDPEIVVGSGGNEGYNYHDY